MTKRRVWIGMVTATVVALTSIGVLQAAEDTRAERQLAASSLAGIYDIVDSFEGDDPALGDLKPLNRLHGPVAAAHLTPWARAKMEASADYSAVDDTGAICQLAGFFRHPTTVAGYMVIQRPKEVYLVSLDLSQVGVRRIHLTDKHPRNLPPSWNGHSIGRWEGDTLIVDTVGFNDKSWLGSELQPHTEELHVTERIRTVRDDAFLEIFTTIDDRKALTAPYSYSRYYKRTAADYESVAHSCNPELGDQQTWNYMRQQAVKQLELNRNAIAGGH